MKKIVSIKHILFAFAAIALPLTAIIASLFCVNGYYSAQSAAANCFKSALCAIASDSPPPPPIRNMKYNFSFLLSSSNGELITMLYVYAAVIVSLLVAIVFLSIFLSRRRDRYKQLALTDSLTGIYNRAGLEDEFGKYMASHPDAKCVEATLDVDDFKVFNDLYGHSLGDEILKSLARELKAEFGDGSIIARCGGDEFVIIIKDKTCKDVKQDLRRFTLSDHLVRSNGKEYKFTVSLGYAEYPLHAKSFSEMYQKSDMALYYAKIHGKHNCCCYHPDYQLSTRSWLGFTMSEVTQHLPGPFLIYKADPDDDTVLCANDELIRLAGCEDFDDFMSFCDGRFSNLIRPDEAERIEKSIWAQIDERKNGTNDYVQFHFARKDGSYRSVLDHGRIVENPNYGRVFYVSFIDCNFIKSHYDEE